MAKAKPWHRLVLHLDPRIALESVILNRHECMPAARRQEWLRGLLVQGFRVECQVLCGAQDDATRKSSTAFINRKAGEVQKSISRPEPVPAAVKVTPSQVDTANKPFAALGKVIG